MIRHHRFASLAAFASISVVGFIPMAQATAATTPTAQAVFDATTTTSPQLVGGQTNPRGPATYTPGANGRLTLNALLTGLTPLTQYVVVAYKDGGCAPAAGVTAFPSPLFTTNTTGAATVTNYPVNPAAINPTATLNVGQINSVSIRLVITTVAGTTIPNLMQTEACDTSITH